MKSCRPQEGTMQIFISEKQQFYRTIETNLLQKYNYFFIRANIIAFYEEKVRKKKKSC